MTKGYKTRSAGKLELHKIVVARSDILSAQQACRLILERVTGLKHELLAPLSQAAVVAYGRPFSGNKGTGTLSRHWSDFPDARLRAVHRKLMDVRNELVAHSDSSVRNVVMVPPGVQFIGQTSVHMAFRVNAFVLGRPIYVDMDDLCTHQIRRMDERIDELTAQLYHGVPLPPYEFPLTLDDRL
jgi:hypothetical protein